jgi:hypothetical protein
MQDSDSNRKGFTPVIPRVLRVKDFDVSFSVFSVTLRLCG